LQNIYVDTGEVSGRLLDKTIEKLEVAQKKMGYNYSADAYLEVAISMAKYESPAGRQSLFNAGFAETAGGLYGNIEEVLGKLKELRSILDSGPDALVDVDKAQKNEITNWWTRSSYWLSSIFFGDTNPGDNTVVVGPVKYQYTGPYADIVNSYDWDQTTATKEEIEETVRLALIAGMESGDISGELRRKLQKLHDEKIITEPNKLTHKMSGSLRQGDYSAYTHPYGYNAGCCAMSYAIAVSIVTQKDVDPTKYWRNGPWGYQTYYDDNAADWVGFDVNKIHSALQEGKPTMVHYKYADSNGDGKSDGEHWVVVVGIREGANVNNLSMSDLLVIDPAYGDERPLTETYRFNSAGVDGGRRVH